MADLQTTLDKQIMNLLSEDQKVAFLKTLLFASKIDDDVDDNEIKFIKKMATKYKVENVRKIFEPIKERDLLIEIGCLRIRRIALELIKELFRLGHTDGELGDEEILFIGRVAQTLGVEVKKIEQISRWVIDHMVWVEQGRIIFEEV